MQNVRWILFAALVGYVLLVALMYVAQRRLMYFPETVRTAPGDAGLSQARELTLTTDDGERVIAWYVPPRDGRDVVLYFHGNGGSLRIRAERFRVLIADGTGLMALSYRGYGGSSGNPTEDGLLHDAFSLYDFALARYPAERLILWGESLGSGVAVALAAERRVARIILESPFTSAADIAAEAYPFVPVRFLMHDQFRTDLRIGKVTAPVLILHGERDTVVPIRYGERLFALVQSPKRFVRFPQHGHNDLGTKAVVDAAREFASRLTP